MTNQGKASTSTIVSAMRYRNPAKMIDWLCDAFGFTRHGVYHDDNGAVVHAQLTYGNGMIMLGPNTEGEWSKHFAQPDEIAGRETQTCCVTVTDCDAHHAQAVAAGAEIIDPLAEKPYGGKGYGARDPEGHLWWFGSYDPWAEVDESSANG